MPTPMPIGSRSQSVAVGPTGWRKFRRRFQAGPVRHRTLSGNVVYRVTGIARLLTPVWVSIHRDGTG